MVIGVQAYDRYRAPCRDRSCDRHHGRDSAGIDDTIGRCLHPLLGLWTNLYAVCQIWRGWGPTVTHGPILIVEDDPTIRQLLCSVLEDDGHDVLAVDNGYDALSAVSLRAPAVILLDLNLPLLSGEGVLDALQQNGVNVPVLLVTSDPRGQRLGMTDGVVGHIPKPFDLDDLLLALRMTVTPDIGLRRADCGEAWA